jgi:hypothetical protein
MVILRYYMTGGFATIREKNNEKIYIGREPYRFFRAVPGGKMPIIKGIP